jgi:protein TonB
VAVAVGQESARPVCGAVLAPELLDEPPPDELLPEELPPEELPLEEAAPEELPLDTPPLEVLELLELLELLEESPPLLLEDPAAAGPATRP